MSIDEKRNYSQEYANYHGSAEQIARRSSRNKARRAMGDKAVKGMDVGHKDNDPLNNDPKNLRMEKPSDNRREPRLREKKKKKPIYATNIDESVTVGDGGGAVNVQKDVPLFTAPDGTAFGSNYWTAPDSDTYANVRLGRKKFQRWNSFVGKTDWARGVSAYAKKNPKGGMLMKHPRDPVFQVIRR